jgi:DNA replication protein DnaC
MKDSLLAPLKALRLSGMAQTLEVRLQEAAGNSLSHEEFLEMILHDEMDIRKDRRIHRQIKAAQFHEQLTLEDFDWTFNPSIKRKQIFDLATCSFIRKAEDVLFVGPPGVGKSHLAQALGHQAIKMNFTVLYRSIFDLVRDFMQDEALMGHTKMLNRYLKPDLVIIDDMGLKQLPKNSGEHIFEIILRRHRNKATVMTSNRPIEEWGKLIGDVPTATAILDRFLQSATVIQIKGKSYRLKNQGKKGN